MRLLHRSIRPVGRPIGFRFDDTPIEALEGETIAAALSAAGIVAYRRTASGVPRGLHCGMGACFDCVVTVDGRIGQRACMTKVAPGMIVTSATVMPLASLAPEPDGAEPEEQACDLLVVGAGPAGLSAAIAAAEAGANVVVLDERSSTGGQYAKPLADSHADRSPDAQFRLGHNLRNRARHAGVRIDTDATVWGAFSPGEIAVLIAGRAVIFRPRRLILAPGAHERPVAIPGWTLPGVMTTGALQTLVRAQRVCPGERVLIAGSGPLNVQLACELLASGVKPLAVVEAAPRPAPTAWQTAWTMARAAPNLVREGIGMLLRLKRAGVPVLWSSEVEALIGDGHVQTARVEGRGFDVDVVALNLGFQPETGLARALGAKHRFVDVGLGHLATETDDDGRTSVPGVFAVGDGAALGGARVAMARGQLAGMAAARELGLHAPDQARIRAALSRAMSFQSALWILFRPPEPVQIGRASCRERV